MNWQEFNNLMDQLIQNSGTINIQPPANLLTDLDNRLTTLDNGLTTLDNRLTTLDNRLRVGDDRPTSDTPPADYYLARNYNEIWHHNGNEWVLVSRAPGGYINLTNATSDHFLQQGEAAIIQAHDATQWPLRIATESGTAYEMWVIPYNPWATSGALAPPIYLNPNNTTYLQQFTYASIYRDANANGSDYYTIYSSFRIGLAYSNIYCQIVNFTQYKNVKGYYEYYGRQETGPALQIFSTDWRDITRPWTSLGTIMWGQPVRAYVIVRRIL